MKVALDVQLAVGTGTGIGEYASGLAQALVAEGAQVVPLRCGALDPWRFDRRVIWDQMLLPLAARRAAADVVHCTSGIVPFLGTGRAPLVATVHDVAWLRTQQHTRAYARMYFGAFMAALYPRAHGIIVDSAFSRAELIELVRVDPGRVRVVFPGVHDDFGRLERNLGRPDTILAVGTVERRKNLAVAIQALAALPAARLISVGPPTPYLDECRALAESLGVSGRVEFRGYVERAALLELYSAAAVAIAPSRYEGFGYAVAQARCAGVPVIAAATSSLIEVADGTAPLLDPDDVAGWTQALRTALDDAAGANERAQAGRSAAIETFSWKTSARAAIAAYEAVL